MRNTISIGGKVKKKTGSLLDSNRSEFLSLDNAEPDLGLPSVDNSMVLSRASGERKFASLTGLLTHDSASGTVSVDSSSITSLIDSAYIQARSTSADFLDSSEVIALIDSSYVQARQITYDTSDFVDSNYVYNNTIDSARTISLIDSAYIQSRQLTYDFLDSTEAINLIDSAYIQARQITYDTSDFADSSFVTTLPISTFNNDENYLDSTTILGVVDSAYVQLRQITYDTSDFVDSNYVYNNTIDSARTISLIDSAYVQLRQLKYDTSDFTDSAYVGNQIDSAINALIGGAPAALDTLNELAEAINDNSDFAGTVTSQLALKLNIADFGSSFDTELATKTTDNLNQGDVNKYYDTSLFDSDFGTKNTDALTQGDTNFYYTTARFDSDFGTKTTLDLTENTNLYFTELRAHDAIATYDSDINTTGSITATSFLGDGSGLTDVQADNTIEEVKNTSGVTLVKGTPVYPTGVAGSAVTIAAADASDSAKMPAIGVLQQDLADDAQGFMIISGKITAVNTTGYTAGDIAYVAVGGGWTDTPPTGESNIVQALGYFTRIDSNGGGVVELGDPRSTSNLADGKIFLGTSGDGEPSRVTLNTSIVPQSGDNKYYSTTLFDSDFGDKTTDDLTEGLTKKYYSTTLFNADFADRSTDSLDEGDINKYYTTTRFDSDFGTKTTDDLTEGTKKFYDSATTQTNARNAISHVDNGGDGSLTYNASTGVITYTGPSAAEVRAHLSDGGGISYNSTTGVISHTDTSSQASINNSNGTVIQDVSVDSYGHVTSLGSVNLDTRYVNTSGDTMTGFLTLHADPTNAFHAATKEYVDNIAQGVKTAPAVRVATTANLVATYDNGTAGVGATLTSTSNGAFPTIDGVDSWEIYNGVLVKDQDSAAHNGRYFVSTVGDGSTPWELTRCPFCDEDSEIPGSYVFVQEGTLYEGTGWIQIVEDVNTFTVGTDDIVVTQFSGAGTNVGGDGIDITGNVISIDSSQLTTIIQNIDGSGSGIDADKLDGEEGSYYRINVYNAAGVLQN